MLKAIMITFCLGAVACAAYAVSICSRVAGAELATFHRNHIFKSLNNEAFDYTQAACDGSFGGKTYKIMRHEKLVTVHKQLINGFQHAYGSALAAFECGELFSDLSFRSVEYLEAYTTRGGRSYLHFLDTKKDLHNNAVGRRVAALARTRGLNGQNADAFIQEQIFLAIESGEIINHFMDPRVVSLPSLTAYGCPGLPSPAPTVN